MGYGSGRTFFAPRWLGMAAVVACAQLAACGISGGNSFACTDEAKELMPMLGKALRSGLAVEKNVRVVEVGQCYEGGKDGYQTSFDSPDLDRTVGVLKQTWKCRDVGIDEGDESVLLKCSVSGATVEFEVDYSVGKGAAYAFLVSPN